MATQASETAVRASVVVEAPQARAFDVFTKEIDTWWDPDHHMLEGELDTMIFEPREGGTVFDRGVDGTECHWARVLTWEPPNRFVISWDISAEWVLETDHARTSEVEVRFIEQGPERTLVELEHRNLDRHGDGWEGMRDAVGAENGWSSGLKRFQEKISG